MIDVAQRTRTRTIEDVGNSSMGDCRQRRRNEGLHRRNGPSADVSFVDVTSGTVERRVATGGSPRGLALK